LAPRNNFCVVALAVILWWLWRWQLHNIGIMIKCDDAIVVAAICCVVCGTFIKSINCNKSEWQWLVRGIEANLAGPNNRTSRPSNRPWMASSSGRRGSSSTAAAEVILSSLATCSRHSFVGDFDLFLAFAFIKMEEVDLHFAVVWNRDLPLNLAPMDDLPRCSGGDILREPLRKRLNKPPFFFFVGDDSAFGASFASVSGFCSFWRTFCFAVFECWTVSILANCQITSHWRGRLVTIYWYIAQWFRFGCNCWSSRRQRRFAFALLVVNSIATQEQTAVYRSGPQTVGTLKVVHSNPSSIFFLCDLLFDRIHWTTVA